MIGVASAAVVAGAERAGSENIAGVLGVVEDFAWPTLLSIILFAGSIAYLYM